MKWRHGEQTMNYRYTPETGIKFENISYPDGKTYKPWSWVVNDPDKVRLYHPEGIMEMGNDGSKWMLRYKK
jgi:hypothetical protein